MEKESKKKVNLKSSTDAGVGGAFYFVGFIGALIYFIQQANTISEGLVGFVKAIFWPAFLVYDLFKFLQV